MTLRTLLEGELEKAEATLAARNLVDEIQDMLQTASKLQVEDLAALVETMRSNMGPEVATAFQASADSALKTVVDTLTKAKADLDNAVLVATGEEGAQPAMDSPELGDDGMGSDLDLGAPSVDDAAAGGDNPLGRGKRDESREALRKQIESLETKLKEAKMKKKKAM